VFRTTVASIDFHLASSASVGATSGIGLVGRVGNTRFTVIP
jgi:hypothetical protein